MTFPELWEVYRKRNAALRKPGGHIVTMSVDNLQRLAKQAYDQGGKAAIPGNSPEPTDMPNWFNDILSGKRT